MIRTFLGLELDDDTRDALRDETSMLKHAAPKVRWVRSEQMHLTVKFIGAVPEAEIEEVFLAADEAAGRIAPYALDITGLGVFPDLRRPRIVWAGCGMGADETTRLAAATEEACAAYGYEKEKRPYHPHVTLGRVKRPADAADLHDRIADAANCSYGLVDVDCLTVFMSELKRSGAAYTPMHRAELRG